MWSEASDAKSAGAGGKSEPHAAGNKRQLRLSTAGGTGELSRRMRADTRLGVQSHSAEPPSSISVQQKVIAIVSVSALVCGLTVLLMAVIGAAACTSVYHMNWSFVPAVVMTAASLMLIFGTWIARPEHRGQQKLTFIKIALYALYLALACAVASFVLGTVSIGCEHWRMSYEPHEVIANTSDGSGSASRTDERVFCSAMRLSTCGLVDVDYATPWYGWLSHVFVATFSLLYVPFAAAAARCTALFVATSRREPKHTAVPFRLPLPHMAERISRVLTGGRVAAQRSYNQSDQVVETTTGVQRGGHKSHTAARGKAINDTLVDGGGSGSGQSAGATARGTTKSREGRDKRKKGTNETLVQTVEGLHASGGKERSAQEQSESKPGGDHLWVPEDEHRADADADADRGHGDPDHDLFVPM